MPVRILTISTATGTFPSTGWVDFGDVYLRAAYAGASSANKDYAGTVEGSIGGSGVWNTIVTLTTSNSTGQVSSTGEPFDKLRFVVTTNNTTAETGVWLAASD